MPSASAIRIAKPVVAAALWTLAIPVAVAGCAGITTTQDQDARLAVKADRSVLNIKKVDVKSANPEVEVTDASVVRNKAGAAIAVDLKNVSDETVNDLPIAVGIEGSKDGEDLNLRGADRYFQAHVGAIGAGETTTWVYSTSKDVPEGKPYAKVGPPSDPPLIVAGALPILEASGDVAGPKGDETTVDVAIDNTSEVPQYDLEVYAVARGDGEVLAAGSATLAELEAGNSGSLDLTLVGDPKDAELAFYVPPTIFE